MPRVALILLGILGASCAGSPMSGPACAVRAYAVALAAGDQAAALARLDTTGRYGRDRKALQQALAVQRSEARTEADAMVAALHRSEALDQHAALELGPADVVVLRHTPGGWRVVSGLP